MRIFVKNGGTMDKSCRFYCSWNTMGIFYIVSRHIVGGRAGGYTVVTGCGAAI